MGKSQRTKGHNFERWVARELRDIWPDSRRGLDQTQEGLAPDVDGTPYYIECKVGKRPPTPEKVLFQAVVAANKAKDARPAVGICRRDGQRPYVVMDLQDWKDLVRKAHDLG